MQMQENANTKESRLHRAFKALFHKNSFGFKLAAAVVGVVIISSIFCAKFQLGYNVAIASKIVGAVPTKEAAQAAVESVNEEYKTYLSGEAAVQETPVLELTIVEKNGFTDEGTLKENIKSTSSEMLKQAVILVDGVAVAGLETVELAQQAISAYVAQFVDENTNYTIENEYQVVEEYAPKSIYVSVEGAVAALGGGTGLENIPVMQVQTVEYQEIESEIPFSTEEVKDDTMYEGNFRVDVEGVDGIQKTTKKVVRINGALQEETVLSEETLVQPVSKVVRTGTKERPAGVGTGTFLQPYNGVLTSRFGSRWSRQHTGIDISGPVGSDIVAADDGVVTFAGWESGYGYMIKIDHNNGYETYYAHCSQLYAQAGDYVAKGDLIAALGNTGRSTGPHVHFEVRQNGTPTDPLNYVTIG